MIKKRFTITASLQWDFLLFKSIPIIPLFFMIGIVRKEINLNSENRITKLQNKK